MAKQSHKIREHILKIVEKHPKDLALLVEKEFGVSKTTVHRHINTLIKNGALIKTGTKRGAQYHLPNALNKNLSFKITPDLEEHDVWTDFLADSFSGLKENIEDICYYGFGEMFNNAKDHSEGGKINVETRIEKDLITISVSDDGIGVFKKIQNHLKVSNLREAVLHLTKGKITTDPARHSGEGIFFSSRAFDSFSIYSNGLLYVKDNEKDDWFFESKEDKNKPKTSVTMKINKNSKRTMLGVFEKYQNEDTQAFEKTHIRVELSKFNEDRFVSRSQAKMILRDLDKFNHIVLDFKDTRSVGQAFVDEVFRVFQNQHPDIKIEHINANEDVEFMVSRGLSTADLNRD